jgi:hypothetical protein
MSERKTDEEVRNCIKALRYISERNPNQIGMFSHFQSIALSWVMGEENDLTLRFDRAMKSTLDTIKFPED